MAKKKKVPGRNDALNELKTLESKWLKDHRMDDLQPVQVKVQAAKLAALLEFVEANELPVSVGNWPLDGAEDLVRMDEPAYKQSLSNLQKVGVINSSYKLRKVAGEKKPELDLQSESGFLTYRCIKPGGVNLSDRDEYILEDHEVTYSEEEISESQALQSAIANEWLMRIEEKAPHA
jgi:hypothetical protein